MFDDDRWTTERKILLATPLTLLLVIPAISFAEISALPALIVIGASALLNFACLLMYHGDAKKTEERAGQKPNWVAYSVASLVLSAYIVAPIYLLNWRGV